MRATPIQTVAPVMPGKKRRATFGRPSPLRGIPRGPRSPATQAAINVTRRRNAIEELRTCVLKFDETGTRWDFNALLRIAQESQLKSVVSHQVPALESERENAERAVHDVMRAMNIPPEIFMVTSRHPALVQARREVWRELREGGMQLLTMEWLTNAPHSNIVISLRQFTPTYKLLWGKS
jgi:hypothetical protein